MVDATVSFAITKLGDFLIQQVNVRIGVIDGVKWLRDELGYLQSSLRDAEAKQHTNNLIHQWMDNVRDVANEAVIIVEMFSALQEEHAPRKQGVLDRLQRCICFCKKEADLFDIGNKIEVLKERVVQIKERRQSYGITINSSEGTSSNILATPNQQVQQRNRTLLRATSFENQADVVGFHDDAKTLLGKLVSGDPSLSLISIHGMGGLGKTTLARKLYNSSESISHFKCRAWVCVSQEYTVQGVLNEIIKSLLGANLNKDVLDLLEKMDEVDLQRHLRKLLEERDSFLAVIDDIWDIKAWKNIKNAFPDKENGSRVVITTRNKKVAERVDDRCFVHGLRSLREDESWELFCKRAKPSPNLEKLGQEMVAKCRGLPLAIVVLGGLLLHTKDWLKVKEHIWRHLKNDSVEIQEILSLSFNDLTLQMRQCFLYLARYPEDHYFAVTKLMRLWIAEEFISEVDEGDGVGMEDVAEDYLNELINRNMIQIANSGWMGLVEVCRIHDLVRDLAIEKAREQKLLEVFDSNKQPPTSSTRLLHGQPRHAIYNGMGKYLELLEPAFDDLKLRSLALNDTYVYEYLQIKEIKLIYSRFKYLKVLDLSSVKSSEIPEEIGDLVLLKFLGLMGNSSGDYLVIPATINKLKKLQTLCGNARTTYQFPEEMCGLKELRHIMIRPRGDLNIGRHQTELQTLARVNYEDWIRINNRGVNLTNLRELEIYDKSREENENRSLESIANLTSLQTFTYSSLGFALIIKPLSSCKRLKRVSLTGKMKFDPSELRVLPDSVMSLTLIDSRFTEDPMPTLGSLSNLTGLYLSQTYIGEKMVFSRNAFPSLQSLVLDSLWNLEELQVEDGALPILKAFSIYSCEKLKILPQQLESLPPVIY